MIKLDNTIFTQQLKGDYEEAMWEYFFSLLFELRHEDYMVPILRKKISFN